MENTLEQLNEVTNRLGLVINEFKLKHQLNLDLNLVKVDDVDSIKPSHLEDTEVSILSSIISFSITLNSIDYMPNKEEKMKYWEYIKEDSIDLLNMLEQSVLNKEPPKVNRNAAIT